MALIALTVLVLGFLAVRTGLKRKSSMVKMIAHMAFVIMVVLVAVLWFAERWNSAQDPRELRSGSYKFKRLHVVNRSKKLRNIYVSYSIRDPLDKTAMKITDSLQLHAETHNNSGALQIRVMTGEKTNFPQDFRVIITDSLGHETENYDAGRFLQNTQTSPENVLDKRAAEIWSLTIN
ncbi:MAG: hypothetical protein EOO01_21655 [Chitinophagaceae bacterium]|nr:MAG: hypothetical protein EOO01_21655 [Chitinophagaceae bacterium]